MGGCRPDLLGIFMKHHEPYEPYTLGHQSNIFLNQLSCVSLLGGAFHFVMSYTSSYICLIYPITYIYIHYIWDDMACIWIIQHWMGPAYPRWSRFSSGWFRRSPVGRLDLQSFLQLSHKSLLWGRGFGWAFQPSTKDEIREFHGNRMVYPTLVYRTLDFMDLNAFFFRDIRTVDFSIDLMGKWWISKWWLNGVFMGISWLELTNCSFNNVPPIEMNNSNTFPQEFLVGYWILIREIGWWINESDCKYRLGHGYKWESVVSYQSIISQYRYMIQVQVRTWMKGNWLSESLTNNLLINLEIWGCLKMMGCLKWQNLWDNMDNADWAVRWTRSASQDMVWENLTASELRLLVNDIDLGKL